MNNKTLQNVAAQIPAVSATRIETDRYIINLEPRISATKLAEYIVAEASRKETIIKNAKKAPKSIIIPYSRVRNALPESFGAEGFSANHLLARAAEAEASESQNKWQQDDNIRSALALKKLAAIAQQIECKNAQQIHRPQGGWGPLMINGVRVSVQPELVFSMLNRNVTKVGAIILNTGKSENLSLDRSSGKFRVADYLTVLVYRMLELRLSATGIPLHTKCYAIDIFRDKVYTAPASHRMLLKNIEASCRVIALQWETFPLEMESDESEAESDLVVGAE